MYVENYLGVDKQKFGWTPESEPFSLSKEDWEVTWGPEDSFLHRKKLLTVKGLFNVKKKT